MGLTMQIDLLLIMVKTLLSGKRQQKHADGKAGFFPATARKLNESAELKRLGIKFSTIIPYRTAKNAEKKFEDLGTACIPDRMSQREKELVAELVRERKLNQNNYLVKDGSLEYRPPSYGIDENCNILSAV